MPLSEKGQAALRQVIAGVETHIEQLAPHAVFEEQVSIANELLAFLKTGLSE